MARGRRAARIDPLLPEDRVDFDAVRVRKERLLHRAYEGWKNRATTRGFQEFVAAGQSPGWTTTSSTRRSRTRTDGRPWYEWEPELVARDPSALARWRDRLKDGISYHSFVQYAFEIQWQACSAACREHGHAADRRRADLRGARQRRRLGAARAVLPGRARAGRWSSRECRPTTSARRASSGEIPLYRVGGPRRRRLFVVGRAAFVSCSAASISCGSTISAASRPTGRSRPARRPRPRGDGCPGRAITFFEAIRRRLGSLPLVAEDLGVITPAVEALRDDFGLPGMRVLQFGFGADPGADKDLPHRHVPHCVVYTGTHDNDTTKGWFTSTEVATTQSRAGDRSRASVRPALCESETTARSTGT